jgi:roadblock/LC7 domain-containing protein
MVTQNVNGNDAQFKVITYEELVSEEKTRQTFAAIGAGLAAAGNSMSAAHAGYYNANSTVFTPRGTYKVQTSGYSPAVAASRSQMPTHRMPN